MLFVTEYLFYSTFLVLKSIPDFVSMLPEREITRNILAKVFFIYILTTFFILLKFNF